MINEMIAIEKKAHAYPWSDKSIKSSFGKTYDVLGIFSDDLLVGYSIWQTIIDESTLMNISISKSHQGLGLGARLLKYSLAYLQEHHPIGMFWLEVRESNTVAKRLYDKLDFVEVDIRPNYYPTENGKEDAIVMSLTVFNFQ